MAPYDPFSQQGAAYLGSLDLELGFASRKISDEQYDQDDLTKQFLRVRSIHHYQEIIIKQMDFRPSKTKFLLQASVSLWTSAISSL